MTLINDYIIFRTYMQSETEEEIERPIQSHVTHQITEIQSYFLRIAAQTNLELNFMNKDREEAEQNELHCHTLYILHNKHNWMPAYGLRLSVTFIKSNGK